MNVLPLEILGISPEFVRGNDVEVVKSAVTAMHRVLAQKYHSDKIGGDDRKLSAINVARDSVLSDMQVAVAELMAKYPVRARKSAAKDIEKEDALLELGSWYKLADFEQDSIEAIWLSRVRQGFKQADLPGKRQDDRVLYPSREMRKIALLVLPDEAPNGVSAYEYFVDDQKRWFRRPMKELPYNLSAPVPDIVPEAYRMQRYTDTGVFYDQVGVIEFLPDFQIVGAYEFTELREITEISTAKRRTDSAVPSRVFRRENVMMRIMKPYVWANSCAVAARWIDSAPVYSEIGRIKVLRLR